MRSTQCTVVNWLIFSLVHQSDEALLHNTRSDWHAQVDQATPRAQNFPLSPRMCHFNTASSSHRFSVCRLNIFPLSFVPFIFSLPSFVVAKPSTRGNVCLKWRRHIPSYQKISFSVFFSHFTESVFMRKFEFLFSHNVPIITRLAPCALRHCMEKFYRESCWLDGQQRLIHASLPFEVRHRRLDQVDIIEMCQRKMMDGDCATANFLST